MAGNPFKKAFEYLGLVEEDETVEYDAPVGAPATAPIATVATPRASVTPIRRQAPRGQTLPDMNEIVTLHPKQYADARTIAEHFREGVPVIMNLSQMPETDARRLIDFASGLSQGLFGRIERVTSKVFLLSPHNVSVTGEAAANTAEVDNSLFVSE